MEKNGYDKQEPINKARERSVNNLQNLYSVVVGLAIAAILVTIKFFEKFFRFSGTFSDLPGYEYKA